MKAKMMSIIVSAFLFMFSVPQSCFAELASFFTKDSNIEISCSASKAVNLLDISNKIVKKYYGDTKDFFFSGYIAGSDQKQAPVYNSKTDKIAINAYEAIKINNKKDNISDHTLINFTGFVNDRMRSSPPGGFEITKQYLLSIEALQKGSVPASSLIVKNNILI